MARQGGGSGHRGGSRADLQRGSGSHHRREGRCQCHQETAMREIGHSGSCPQEDKEELIHMGQANNYFIFMSFLFFL